MYARPLTNQIINWQVISCKEDSVIKYALQLHLLDETHSKFSLKRIWNIDLNDSSIAEYYESP